LFLKQNPWPYGLAAALGLFVAVQMAFVRIATRGFEGPDNVQYYRMGIQYSEEVRRQQLQRELGWHLESSVEPGRFRARMLDASGKPLDGKMTVKFRRPVTKKNDQQLLTTVKDGYHHADWQSSPGQWVIEVQFEQGRLVWKGERRWMP
jgi:nitrogen fixation protein FixH